MEESPAPAVRGVIVVEVAAADSERLMADVAWTCGRGGDGDGQRAARGVGGGAGVRRNMLHSISSS